MKNRPWKIKGDNKWRGTTLFCKIVRRLPRQCAHWLAMTAILFCLFCAFTGAPGNAYLSTSQLQGHVPLFPTYPFAATGALWRLESSVLSSSQLLSIVNVIIARKQRFCQYNSFQTKFLFSLRISTAPKPPLCKGRWAADRRLGGIVNVKTSCCTTVLLYKKQSPSQKS